MQVQFKLMLAGFFAMACSTNPDTFNVDALNPKQQDAFRLAAEIWCKATNGVRCPKLGQDGDSVVLSVDVIPDFYGDRARLPGGASRIRVVKSLSGDSLVETLVHELGHHLGCEESSSKDDVMYYIKSDLRFPTEKDITCAR